MLINYARDWYNYWSIAELGTGSYTNSGYCVTKLKTKSKDNSCSHRGCWGVCSPGVRAYELLPEAQARMSGVRDGIVVAKDYDL